MKPTIKLAVTRTPDGGEMELYQHDHDFLINVNGKELMNSRRHESELGLARLGCAHLSDYQSARVLVGGLGMGYTLRQALDMLRPDAGVVVCELLPAVVEWNCKILGQLNNHPLTDQRTELVIGDVFELITRSTAGFDAILLDIDNGPFAITDTANQRLYGLAGIQACRRALRKLGRLAVWSSEPSPKFEQLLRNCGFHVRRHEVAAHRGRRSKMCFVWVAVEDKTLLSGKDQERVPAVQSG